MSDTEPKRTPLSSLFESLGGKLVDFSGWSMAINFEQGIKREHLWTRKHASLFDVSHMGQIEIRGSNVAEKLEQLAAGDVINLPQGKARYTQFTDHSGGILDDLIISNAGDHYYLVVNASMFDQDFKHLQSALPDLDYQVRYDRALIALQGPSSATIIGQYTPEASELRFMETTSAAINGTQCRISRLGYTGEDGYEIAIPKPQAVAITELLLSHPECEPAGLGARDSLRLEAGLCLYGNDINIDTSPVEAGLTWSIPKRRREQAGFPGAERIIDEINHGTSRQLVGILPNSKMPARQGCQVLSASGDKIGIITSGGFGPSCNSPISMGYVDSSHAEIGTSLLLQVRNKQIAANVVAMPFVKQNYQR